MGKFTKEKEKNMENEKRKKVSVLVKLKSTLIKGGIVVTILLVTVLAVYFKGRSSAEEKYVDIIKKLEEENARLSEPTTVYIEATKEVDISIINAEIKDIGEFATIEYMYTDAGKFEDTAEMFGKEIPLLLTTKSFIAKWDGNIKAGIDISKVKAEENKLSKEIIIHIPKAEILSHEIEEDSIETLDQKDGLFNPVKVEDVREFDAKSKAEMEKRAIENGILDKAYENAKDIIYKLVFTEAVKELEYSIIFETIE